MQIDPQDTKRLRMNAPNLLRTRWKSFQASRPKRQRSLMLIGLILLILLVLSGASIGIYHLVTGKSLANASSTWHAQTFSTSNPLKGIAWSGSQFVAVGGTILSGAGGTILTSPDGSTWTARTSGTSKALEDVIWSGSQFVAVGEQGTILTSP